MMVIRRSAAVAVLAATAALVPVSVAWAAEPVSTASPAAAAQSDRLIQAGSVDVISGSAGVAKQIYNVALDQAEIKDNRSGVVRGLREAAWYETGERRNVLVIKADHKYSRNIKGIVSDATYKYGGYPAFRVVVFSSGTVTNKGDGGYINWAYRGWFSRSGQTVTFRLP